MKRLVGALALSLAATAAFAAPQVALHTTQGDIVVELDDARAPATTANFLQYVKEGFYNGTIFHRVIDDFMIQGGGFTRDMTQKPTRAPIGNEADNGLKNTAYTIAMARTADPHSATAQFFINVRDNVSLNHRDSTPRGWGYAVFGKVVKGREVVDKIKSVATTTQGPYQNVPTHPIVIEKAEVLNP